MAFLPNSVDCGPRSTSIRWTSGRSAICAAVRDCDRRRRRTRRPTARCPALLAPLPKPRMKKLVLAELCRWPTRSDGTTAGQVLEVADLRALDRLGGGHADRDRHVLQGLLALGGGDDDLVALAVVVGRGRGVGRLGDFFLSWAWPRGMTSGESSGAGVAARCGSGAKPGDAKRSSMRILLLRRREDCPGADRSIRATAHPLFFLREA